MSIVRVERTSRYTVVPNHVWEDDRISLKAKGALGIWLSRPDEWNPRSDWLATTGPDGREACRAANAELQRAGYLYRYRQQGETDGLWDTVTIIHDTPLDPVPDIDAHGYQQPLTDNRRRKTRTPVNPVTGVPNALATTEEQLLKNNRKNNSSTTSKSRSSQRASAHRGDTMDDPVDSVFDKEQDDEADTINPRGGPDSAWGLNKHYRDSVRVAGNGFLGNTNDKAMRGFFAKAKREGVKPDVLRAMVDAFVIDERLFTKATGGARWRVFIANAESLRQRVVGPMTYRAGAFEEVPDFGGSIPQHILDEILAETG